MGGRKRTSGGIKSDSVLGGNMNRQEKMHGKPGVKYGIYNTSRKEFQFGISEDTPLLAEARLIQKIGDDARKWRFEARRILDKKEM